MVVRAAFVGAAVTAGAAVVISGAALAPPVRADDTDQAFIQTIDDYGMDYGKPEKAILAAKLDVCGGLDADPTETFSDVVYNLAANTNWSNDDSAFFAGAAIAAYCPQYRYKVGR